MDERKIKTIAIICTRKESERFPLKNRLLIGDVLKRIEGASFLDKILVASDDEELQPKEGCSRIHRISLTKKICHKDNSVFGSARWAYNSIEEDYDVVVMILTNVIRFESVYVNKCIDILLKNNLNEVRTYDKDGVENGVIVMKRDWFLKGSLSVYCGGVLSSAKEIHYEDELE